VTAQASLKYGLVSTKADPADDSRIFLRMSNFLLRHFLKTEKTLEEMFAFDKWSLASAMPVGLDLHDNVLITCRSHTDKTQAVAQLLSLLVTCTALLLMEEGPRPLTLASLRPGAEILGDAAQAEKVLAAMTEAAREVKEAGDFAFSDTREVLSKKRKAKVRARHTAAIAQAVKLVAPADAPGAATTAALFHALNFPGFDMWAQLHDGLYLGQSKGAADPLKRDSVAYTEASTWLEKMVNVASGRAAGEKDEGQGQGQGQRKGQRKAKGKGKGRPALASLGESGKQPLGLELLVARHISPSCLAKMQAQVKNEPHCILVIDKERLTTALGPIFGGIAARCIEKAEGDDDAA